MWALILIIHLSSGGIREELINDHHPDWFSCMQHGFAEMKNHRGVVGITCQQSKGQGT